MARRMEHELVGAAIGAMGGVAYSMETPGPGGNGEQSAAEASQGAGGACRTITTRAASIR